MAWRIGYQLGIVLLLSSNLLAEGTEASTGSPSPILIPNDASGLYFSLCADCHGPNGTPDPRVAELFDPPPKNFAESVATNNSELLSTIWNGKSGMPGFSSRLNRSQAQRLADYIKQISKGSTN